MSDHLDVWEVSFTGGQWMRDQKVYHSPLPSYKALIVPPSMAEFLSFQCTQAASKDALHLEDVRSVALEMQGRTATHGFNGPISSERPSHLAAIAGEVEACGDWGIFVQQP